MLSEAQYNIVRPHAEAIKLTAQTGSAPSTAPWEAMQTLRGQLGMPPVDGYCPSCALQLYQDIAAMIIEYEVKLPIFNMAIDDNPDSGVQNINLSNDGLMPWQKQTK